MPWGIWAYLICLQPYNDWALEPPPIYKVIFPFCVCNTWREHMPMLILIFIKVIKIVFPITFIFNSIVHSFSWCIPQRWLHFNPFFLQEHRKVEQSVLHLHQVMANNLSGAALWSVVIGARELFTVFQPQSSALMPGIFNHFKIWKYAL